jgi:hypothetical protein
LAEGTERRTARRVLIDLSPLRRSRDLCCLVLGELVSVLGTQLTTVAVPYQVYQLTHSSLARVLPGFRRQRTPEHSGPSRTLDTAPTGRDPSE